MTTTILLDENVNNSHLGLRSNLGETMTISLSELEIGEKAIITGLDEGHHAHYRQKLLAFGVIPGAKVQLMRIAPLGDPLELKLELGILISIRKVEGHIVKVKRITS